MQVKLRLGIVGVALMAVVSSTSAQNPSPAKPATQTQAQAAAPAGKVENGGVLYKKVGCYQCHANEAQGGLSGPRIGPNLIPYARFSQYTRRPTGDMPPYTTKCSRIRKSPTSTRG